MTEASSRGLKRRYEWTQHERRKSSVERDMKPSVGFLKMGKTCLNANGKG